MNKNVMLTISGLHQNTGAEDANMETVTAAEYFKKNESHYLLYEEKTDGFEQVSKNRIKFKSNMLELTRQGLMATHMIFEENKTHMTPYATPYGVIHLSVHTKKVQVQEQEKHITVTVEYTLEAEEEHMSDCRIVLQICYCNKE